MIDHGRRDICLVFKEYKLLSNATVYSILKMVNGGLTNK